MTQDNTQHLRFTLNARVTHQYFVYKSYRFLMIGAAGLKGFYPVLILRISQKALPTDRGACSTEGNASHDTHRRAFCMNGGSPHPPGKKERKGSTKQESGCNVFAAVSAAGTALWVPQAARSICRRGHHVAVSSARSCSKNSLTSSLRYV